MSKLDKLIGVMCLIAIVLMTYSKHHLAEELILLNVIALALKIGIAKEE